MNPSRKILSAAGTVGGATLLSRILGFIRDMVVAWSFPPGVRDAFFVAFRLPNTMRRLFGEGAMVISFIPVFTDIVKKDKDEARKVFDISSTLLTIVLAVLITLGIIFSKEVLWVFAPGFYNDTQKARLTIILLQVMFPFLLLVSLVALAQGVLNTLNHYLAPAIAPALLNVFMIAGTLFLSRYFSTPALGLALGVLAGGFAMLLIQFPFLAKRGFIPRPRLNYRHPAVKQILLLMAPAAFGLLVYQFNMLVSTILASLLPEGSVSWLFYAQRFTELPLGIFAVAIGTAALPALSAHITDNDKAGFRSSYLYSLNLVMFLTIPSALGIMALSMPIFSAFFQRGNFDFYETSMSANALIAYALGLPAIAGARVTAPAFYAQKDTRTPVRIAVWSFFVNLLFSVILMGVGYITEPVFNKFGFTVTNKFWYALSSHKFLAHTGLALATSISAWYNFLTLTLILHKRIGGLNYKAVFNSIAKTSAASLIMTLVVYITIHLNTANWGKTGVNLDKVATLLGATIIGVAVFSGVSYLLKQQELRDILSGLSRRLKAKRKTF